jgi:hypothetical protein
LLDLLGWFGAGCCGRTVATGAAHGAGRGLARPKDTDKASASKEKSNGNGQYDKNFLVHDGVFTRGYKI